MLKPPSIPLVAGQVGCKRPILFYNALIPPFFTKRDAVPSRYVCVFCLVYNKICSLSLNHESFNIFSKQMHKIYPLLTFCLAFFVGCFVMENQYAVLPPGIWRATLELEPQQAQLNRTKIPKAERSSVHFEEVSDAELPFNFEIIYTN